MLRRTLQQKRDIAFRFWNYNENLIDDNSTALPGRLRRKYRSSSFSYDVLAADKVASRFTNERQYSFLTSASIKYHC